MAQPSVDDFNRIRTTREICGDTRVECIETKEFLERGQFELANAALFVLQFGDVCSMALCVKFNDQRGPCGDTVFANWIRGVEMRHLPPPVVFSYRHLGHPSDDIDGWTWGLDRMYEPDLAHLG